MIAYFARGYFALLAALTALFAAAPVLFSNAPLGATLHAALLWAGVLAAPLTYAEVRRRRLWPLLDSLRVSRLGLLAALTAAGQLLHLAFLAL